MALDPITAIAEGGGKLLDIIRRFVPDNDKAQEAAREVTGYAQQLALAQIELNKQEAQHHSLWVAGWRPAIGWVSAASLGLYYIPRIILNNVMWVWACFKAGALVTYPEMPMADLFALVGGMLGFGILRSWDKKGGNGT